MADCHVPLTIPEANAGRISAPVPPPPVTKVANGEKENKEHNLCTDPYPRFLHEKSRGGRGGLDTGYNEQRSEETKIQVP